MPHLFVAAAVVILVVIVAVMTKGDKRYRRCQSRRRLTLKTALITGASSGIGKETARDFAARGARVLMACRNVAKARTVAGSFDLFESSLLRGLSLEWQRSIPAYVIVFCPKFVNEDEIIKSTGNNNVVIYKLDTSDLESVRNCSTEILEREHRLDILVNNAGCGGHSERELTEDGLELTMATNHYGHFLLTNLLLGLIRKSAPARIVTVSSGLHILCTSLDTEDLNFENTPCSVLSTYTQSKLCNALFAFELSRKLKSTGVTSTVVRPGLVATEIFQKSKSLLTKLLGIFAFFIAKTAEQGAQTTIYAAVSEEVEDVTGKYFDDCQIASSSSLSMNIEVAQKLWESSVRDVKLKPQEILY